MKLFINAKGQPGFVVAETDLTPAYFAGNKVVDLVDKEGKKVGFSFALTSSGDTDITKNGITFVGTKKDKKLIATVKLEKFGSVEDAKMYLGDILPKAEDLEKQMVKAYQARVAAADKITVEE